MTLYASSTLKYTARCTIGSSAAIDLIDRLAVLYLAAPLFFFFLGWFRPLHGGLLVTATLIALLPLRKSAISSIQLSITKPVILLIASIAFLWSAFGGAGHFFYANDDWLVRDAVLRDLVVASWPVAYGDGDGFDLILRCPLAFYLPAASIAKIIGVAHADIVLFLWTALGVFLFFMLAVVRAKNLRQIAVILAVIVLFSGMDALALLILGLPIPDPPTHLEWWARYFQYSSNSTQLFWVPNHALPAWLIAGLIFKHRSSSDLLKILPIALASTALWSPLATIGLAPFLLFLACRNWRQVFSGALSPLPWLCAGVVFLAIAAYITLDGSRIPSLWTIYKTPSFMFPRVAFIYFTFVLAEFGLLAILLLTKRWDGLVALSALILMFLPLYTFGEANDLAMRGSIPGLTILCMSTAYAISHVNWRKPFRREVLLVLCIATGAVTPYYEFYRAVSQPSWQPNLNGNLLTVTHEPPAHYVGRLNSPQLRILLDQPRRMTSDAENLKEGR